MRKILVIQGHPNGASYCASLADQYAKTAKLNGLEVDELRLHELKFDPILHFAFSGEQLLEPDLKAAQERILNAEHLVWIFPNWWGSLPALLKGFIDRTFLPGFAFKYKSGLGFPDQLLKGKTADLIITLDTPPIIYKFFMGAPGVKIMKSAILEFCGIKVRNTFLIGSVRGSSEEQRAKWLRVVEKAALSLRRK